MSGFCTAPENIVYWAFSRKKKCSLQHFGYCSSRCVDVSCFFDEFCSLNTYGHMLEHRYKPVKTNRKLQVLKSLRGLSFQKDAAIATTHTSRWKKKKKQAPSEPNEGVGHEWMEESNKWMHEWGIKETCSVYTVSESSSRHMSTNMCRRLCDYMPRTVLKGEEEVYSHCEQLVVNYQTFLYKKKRTHCGAIPFNQLYFLLENQQKNRVRWWSLVATRKQATGTCRRICQNIL